MEKTDALDILGVCCIALFAYSIFPPACLLVFGVAAIAMSLAHAPAKPKDDE